MKFEARHGHVAQSSLGAKGHSSLVLVLVVVLDFIWKFDYEEEDDARFFALCFGQHALTSSPTTMQSGTFNQL
jgi:hypothetical protein